MYTSESMRFNSSQAPAEQERPARTAACSRSFTAAGVTTAAPGCAPEAVHGAPSLQTMTWTNCGDFAEDEEVRDVFVSLSEEKNIFFGLLLQPIRLQNFLKDANGFTPKFLYYYDSYTIFRRKERHWRKCVLFCINSSSFWEHKNREREKRADTSLKQ